MIILRWNQSRFHDHLVLDNSQAAISIRTDATIVVQLLLGRVGGGAVQGIAALFANQHALQQGRLGGAPRRMTLVLLQLLFCQREHLFAHQAPGPQSMQRGAARDDQRRGSARLSVDAEGA
jgi:hypothetical protein